MQLYHTLMAASVGAVAVLLGAAAPTGFPKAARPVADIVSPIWSTPAQRDAAHEAQQITERLKLKPGDVVADVGAGSGYDTLRLAKVVGPKGRIVAEDVTPAYLNDLGDAVRKAGLHNVSVKLGTVDDPRLPPGMFDAAIMVHMYHEIGEPYAFLYNMAAALKPGALVGVEELDRPTAYHGTPPALLRCEFEAVGYHEVSQAPLAGGIGYFAVFTPPPADRRPTPDRIKPCAVKG